MLITSPRLPGPHSCTNNVSLWYCGMSVTHSFIHSFNKTVLVSSGSQWTELSEGQAVIAMAQLSPDTGGRGRCGPRASTQYLWKGALLGAGE